MSVNEAALAHAIHGIESIISRIMADQVLATGSPTFFAQVIVPLIRSFAKCSQTIDRMLQNQMKTSNNPDWSLFKRELDKLVFRSKDVSPDEQDSISSCESATGFFKPDTPPTNSPPRFKILKIEDQKTKQVLYDARNPRHFLPKSPRRIDQNGNTGLRYTNADPNNAQTFEDLTHIVTDCFSNAMSETVLTSKLRNKDLHSHLKTVVLPIQRMFAKYSNAVYNFVERKILLEGGSDRVESWRVIKAELDKVHFRVKAT